MYFSIVPNIQYDEKPIKYPFSESDFVVAKNFFRRYKVSDDIFSSAVYFTKFSIPDGMRPDAVALKAYGNEFGLICSNHLRQILGYNSRVPTSLLEFYQTDENRFYQSDQG